MRLLFSLKGPKEIFHSFMDFFYLITLDVNVGVFEPF